MWNISKLKVYCFNMACETYTKCVIFWCNICNAVWQSTLICERRWDDRITISANKHKTDTLVPIITLITPNDIFESINKSCWQSSVLTDLILYVFYIIIVSQRRAIFSFATFFRQVDLVISYFWNRDHSIVRIRKALIFIFLNFNSIFIFNKLEHLLDTN